MSKVTPTRRSRASAQAAIDRGERESGEGAKDTYPSPEPPRRKGDNDIRPDPDIDLGGLEWIGRPGDGEPEGPDES